MSKMNLCIDIDGTITNPYCWLGIANKYFGTSLTPDMIINNDVMKNFNISESQYNNFYKKYGEEILKSSTLRKNAQKILWKLYNYYNIYYVTARETKYSDLTLNWLLKNNLPMTDLYVLGERKKNSTAQFLNCDIFIEDTYENAQSLAKDKFYVLLIDCNYNRLPLENNIKRVFNWDEIYYEILKYSYIKSCTVSQ